MGLFNFANSKREPAAPWTKKIGKAIATLFDLEDGSQPVARIGDRETFTSMGVSSEGSVVVPDLWKVYNDRKSVYADIERMIAEDELVSTAIDVVADRAIGNSDARQSFKKKAKRTAFAVSSDNPEVQRIIDNLNRRLKIESEIWQIIHEFYPHGNGFREVIIDKQAMRIKGFKQTVSYQIWPKVNDHGDKLPGWTVVTDQDVASQGGKELEEWQIVPFIYGHRRGYLAVAPLASARKNWMRLSTMEDGMVIARNSRGYDKIVHRVPVKSEWQRDEIMATIKRYKDAITKRRFVASDGTMTNVDNPLSVDTDFFLPDDGSGKGGVTMLTSNNTGLGNLNDVQYSREKLVCRLKVPVSYLQLASGQKTHLTAGNGSSNAEIAFAYTLQRVQDTVIDGLSRLYDLELMLNGIAPVEGLYTIELSQVITRDRVADADIELTYGQAAVYFVEAFGALPAELIADKFMQLNREQQEMMTTFLAGGDSTKIWNAKVKGIEAGANALAAKSDLTKDRTPGDNPKGTGSGNNNKTRAARSSEQKGAKAAQSVSLESLVDLFASVYDRLADNLRQGEGQDIPSFDEVDREAVRQQILEQVSQDGQLVIS
jgi:hypothetical protein